MTEEERRRELEKNRITSAEAVRRRRARETPAERAKRLKDSRERMRRLRAN
jgi:hypothetical protein